MNRSYKELAIQHIKHEIMDYRYYESRCRWLTKKIEEIDDKLTHGTAKSVPIFREPGGSSQITGNWIVAAISDQQDLEKERDMYQHKLDEIDSWLSLLSGPERAVVKGYLIDRKDPAEIALTLDPAPASRSIYRSVAKSLELIAGF